jgi:glutaminyl-peptide cyclotransferase
VKRLILLLLILLLAIVSKGQQEYQPMSGFPQAINYRLEILNVYPHDANAFTQGLLWHEGVLYESTGQPGESSLRRLDITTGEILQIHPVSRSTEELEAGMTDYFAEGLTLVDEQLIQLTWHEETAFVYDLETFEQLDTISYGGQGWGICNDGRYFYMSDSTEYLAIRELETMELIGRMLVMVNGSRLQAGLLNELECVGDSVYGNLWQTDYIVEIDKFTGNVTGLIDASGLLTPELIREMPDFIEDPNTGEVHAPGNNVLNGIAYNPESGSFYITGKYWPRLFEVIFVPTE